MLVTAKPSPEVAVIDIGTERWSTRLFLLAVVAELLTEVRRIVINDGGDFVGMVSTDHIRKMLRLLHPEADQGEREQSIAPLPKAPNQALSEIVDRWHNVLKELPGQSSMEQAVQMTVTRTALLRCLGDGMRAGALQVVDPDQTTVLDLLRVLDYPNEFVPVVAEPASSNETRLPSHTRLRVINKTMLNAQLAKNSIDDMLTSPGLRFRL